MKGSGTRFSLNHWAQDVGAPLERRPLHWLQYVQLPPQRHITALCLCVAAPAACLCSCGADPTAQLCSLPVQSRSNSCRPDGTLVRSARQFVHLPPRRHSSTQQLIHYRPGGTSLLTACANTFVQWPPRRHSPASPVSIHKKSSVCHATQVAGRWELTSRTTTQRYQRPPHSVGEAPARGAHYSSGAPRHPLVVRLRIHIAVADPVPLHSIVVVPYI